MSRPLTNSDLLRILDLAPNSAELRSFVDGFGGFEAVKKILSKCALAPKVDPASPGAQPEGVSEAILDPPVTVDQKRLRIMRRNEGLALLTGCGSPEIGKFRESSSPEKFDLMTDAEVDYWFDGACEEFRKRTGRTPPISSRRLT